MVVGKVDRSVTKWLGKIPGVNLKQVLLRFTQNGIHVKQADTLKYRYVDGNISPKDPAISEWTCQEPIDVPIEDLDTLIRIIGSFEDLITVEVTPQALILQTDSRKLRYLLIDKNFIKFVDELNFSQPTFSNRLVEFEVPSKLLQAVAKSIGLIKSKSVFVRLEDDGTLTISVGSLNENTLTEKAKVSNPEKIAFETSYSAELLNELIGTISQDKVIVSFIRGKNPGDAGAICIKEVGETQLFTNYLAKAKVGESAKDEKKEEKSEKEAPK